MTASLFSDRGLRLVDAYSRPVEPPIHPDVIRDEAIFAAEREIWSDPDELDTAANREGVQLSPALCRQLVLIKAHLDASPEREDGDYRRALRELVRCVDKEVHNAACREVDEPDFDPPRAA